MAVSWFNAAVAQPGDSPNPKAWAALAASARTHLSIANTHALHWRREHVFNAAARAIDG